MKKCKIKDLSENMSLVGCKLGKQFIVSGWQKGFWMSDSYKDYLSGKQTKIQPLFFKDYEEIKNWEIEVPSGRV